MSDHDDLWEDSGLPLLFDHFGDAGRFTYTARGGVAVAPTAIIGDEESMEEPYAGGRRRVVRRTIGVTTDPDGTFGGIAMPALNAVATVDTIQYAVEKLSKRGRGDVDIILVRHEPLEVSRADYRELKK